MTINLYILPILIPNHNLVVPPSFHTINIDAIEGQSQYKYETNTTDTPQFDWNITLVDTLSIDKPTTVQGIYNLRTTYLLDDRNYDVELFKLDCVTPPTGIDNFPLIWKQATEQHLTDGSIREIETELEWTYNQTLVESSDIWTANKTGGYSEFCIKVNNYLPEEGGGPDPFYREIQFLEVQYRIEVDSLTDFNTTIDVFRIEATDGNADGVEFINYEEEIEVYQCRDNFDEITSPVPLTQGDFLQLCVTTVADSSFGVHSIKELDVSQTDTTPDLYPYIDGFITSPIAFTECIDSNTTSAVCRAKMQLVSVWFDLDEPDDLFANGTVKLDYVGRRLSVDVPVSLRYGKAASNAVGAARDLAEEEGGPSFGIEVSIEGNGASMGESDAAGLSIGGLFSAGMAFLASFLV